MQEVEGDAIKKLERAVGNIGLPNYRRDTCRNR